MDGSFWLTTGLSWFITSRTAGAKLGCFLFENQLGAEVTVTFTRQEPPWNITFKILGNQSHAQCFEPGRYTYTLDAPPPWNSVNGDLHIEAGDRYRFPIQAR